MLIDIPPTAIATVELDDGDMLRTTIEATDAWGAVHTARVTWMPEPLIGLDESADEHGVTQIAWADECPVHWEAHRSTHVMLLCERIRQFKAHEGARVVRAEQVYSARAVKPGAYFVDLLDTDD